jgi:hypothetical protein
MRGINVISSPTLVRARNPAKEWNIPHRLDAVAWDGIRSEARMPVIFETLLTALNAKEFEFDSVPGSTTEYAIFFPSSEAGTCAALPGVLQD